MADEPTQENFGFSSIVDAQTNTRTTTPLADDVCDATVNASAFAGISSYRLPMADVLIKGPIGSGWG